MKWMCLLLGILFIASLSWGFLQKQALNKFEERHDQTEQELSVNKKSLVHLQSRYDEMKEQNEALQVGVIEKEKRWQNQIEEANNAKFATETELAKAKAEIETLNIVKQDLMLTARANESVAEASISELDIATKELEEKKQESPMAAMLKQMMENDDMKKMVKMQVENQLNSSWHDFATDMPVDLRNTFMEKLREFTVEQGMVGMSIISMSADERKAMAEELVNARGVFVNEVESILGEEYSQEYKKYESTLPARQLYSTLGLMGFHLADEKKSKQLLDLCIETHGKLAFEDNPNDQYDMEKSLANTDKLLTRQEELSKTVLENSKNLLSETEHKKLEATFGQYQMQLKMGLEMTKKMLVPEQKTAE